jgi:hypothetical protein
MSTRVDIEEIEATKSEKFLAVILVAFLLIGSIWFYLKVDEWVPGGSNGPATVAEMKADQAQERAWTREAAAEAHLSKEKSELSLAKNAFDIAAAKGSGVPAAEAAYSREESEFRAAQQRASAANHEVHTASAAVDALAKARAKESHAPHVWTVAGIRLAFIVGWLLASFRLVSRLRRRQSRFLPLGFAATGAGVLTALVYATDYITDYIDPLDLGPIVLSAAGAGATIGAFVGLQRWLARRIPGRRVRNGECPFCGHPVRADGPHCEGCGREVIASCASCGEARRVGSPHCARCGKA